MILHFEGFEEQNRKALLGIFGAFARVVSHYSLLEIVVNAAIEGIISTLEQIDYPLLLLIWHDSMDELEVVIAFYDAMDTLEGRTIRKTAKPDKYKHIDFKPPQGVAEEAAEGLEMRKENGGKGGLSNEQAAKAGVGSGTQRATNLKNRDEMSPDSIRRMKAFFSRHEKNIKIKPGTAPESNRGWVAGKLWGGNSGKAWANKVCKQMDAADEKE